MRAQLAVWLAALAVATLTACPAAVAPIGEVAFACDDSSACAPGYACIGGRCQPTGTVPPDAAIIDADDGERGPADRVASDHLGADRSATDRTASDQARQDSAAQDGPADAAAGDAEGADGAASDATSGVDAGPGDGAAGDHGGVDGALADGAAGDATPSDAASNLDATGRDSASGEAGPACPADWWDCDWAARLRLSFDNSQQGEDLVDFPVLVHLTPTRAALDRFAAGGADLRFVASDGVQLLAHEIEDWTDGVEGWVWVQVPHIAASSTSAHIWLYHDNPGATDAQNPGAVWSAGYRAVWHLAGSAASTLPLPGTNLSSNLRSSGSDGVAGRGLTLDGSGDRVLLTADDAVLGTLDSMTISAWVRRDEVANGWRGLLSARRSGEDDFGAGNFVFQAYRDQFGFENNMPFPNTWSGEIATPRQWHLLTMVVDTTAARGLLYLDGREAARWDNASNTPTWSDQNQIRLGARWHHGAEQDYLDGALDEVRVAHVARSADWLRAQYLAQSDAFIRYGDEPWRSPEHSHRVKLQLVSAELRENLRDFPVLVTVDPGEIDYSEIQADGADLRFVDADGQPLDHEIDRWVDEGLSQIWVRVPQVNAYNVTDHLWMYYGNPTLPSGEDPAGVWSDDHLGVWHLDDGADSSARGNHGTDHGTAAATGLVGGARDVDDDSTEQRIEIDDSASLDEIDDELTASVWVLRQNGQTDWACAMGREWGSGGYNIFWLGFTGNRHMFITTRTMSEVQLTTVSPTPPEGAWYQLAGTYNGRKMRLFADGQQVAVVDRTGGLPTDNNPLALGNDTNDHGSSWNEAPEALLDEARLLRVARSPAWLQADFWAMTGTLILVDTPQQQ